MNRLASQEWMQRHWRAIEADHDGMPIRDILLAYREDGVPWHVIAGALGVSCNTIKAWRRLLDLPVPDAKVPQDHSRRQERCQRLSAQIIACRQAMTVQQAAEYLGVSRGTVSRLTPIDCQTHYLTPEGRERIVAAARRTRASGRYPPSLSHPWYATFSHSGGRNP